MKKNKHGFNYETCYSLECFFDYINMPPINTSVTILKECVKILLGDRLLKPSFKLIKQIVSDIGLKWENEIFVLRYYLKQWNKSNKNLFNKKYPNLQIDDNRILDLLKTLKIAYLSNIHPVDYCNLYVINKKLQADRISDRKILRSNII